MTIRVGFGWFSRPKAARPAGSPSILSSPTRPRVTRAGVPLEHQYCKQIRSW